MTASVAVLYAAIALGIPAGGVGNVVIGNTGGNLTVETGNTTVNNVVNNVVNNTVNKNGRLKLDAKDRMYLAGVLKASFQDFFKKMEESNQAKRPDKELDVDLLKETVQKALQDSFSSASGLEKLAARSDRTDQHLDALIAEIKGLREEYRVSEAQRRLDEESWRTSSGWGLMLSPTAGLGWGTVSTSAGANVQVVWAGPAWSFLSEWSRAVRPIAGITVGYESMWREKQLIGAGDALGTVREDLVGAGAVGGLLFQWQQWSLSGETELRTRPFDGLGVRWSLGAYGAMRLGKDWWVRVGANGAPVDTGAAVVDTAYDPLGNATPYTSYVASPRLAVTAGVMALLY